MKRIIPAYWLAFIFVTYVLHADQVNHGAGALAIYLGFAQIYFPTYVLSGVTQAWSLCTEMSFYLALPLWALLMGRKRRDPDSQMKVELTGLAGLVALSVVYRVTVLQGHGMLALTMPNWLPGYADLFAFGMLLAVFNAWSEATGREPRLLWHPALPWVSWGLATAAFIGVSNIGLPWTPVTASPVGLSLARQTLYGLFAFFLVLPAVVGRQDSGLVRRLLAFKPLALIGVVSYGIYLWHEAWIELFLRWTGDKIFTIPLAELVAFAGGLAALSAAASYLIVERPVLNGNLRLRRERAGAAGAAVAGEGATPVPTVAGRP